MLLLSQVGNPFPGLNINDVDAHRFVTITDLEVENNQCTDYHEYQEQVRALAKHLNAFAAFGSLWLRLLFAFCMFHSQKDSGPDDDQQGEYDLGYHYVFSSGFMDAMITKSML